MGVPFMARNDSPEPIKCQFAGATSVINYESIFISLDAIMFVSPPFTLSHARDGIYRN